MSNDSSTPKWAIGCGLAVGLAVVALVVFNMVVGAFGGTGYWNHKVDADQVGVVFQGGQPTKVLGPGVYSCFPCIGEFLTVKNISVHGLQFSADDPEIITADQYRIGATVTGTVLRPGVGSADRVLKDWANYNQFYTDDSALIGIQSKDKDGHFVVTSPGLMQQFAKQALKVCVGDRKFNDVVIGTARDAVRQCVDQEMTGLSSNYGLTIQNVVVPNFNLSPELQKQLDAQSAATQAIQVAKQQQLQADAEGQRQVAQNKAKIDVEQSTAQEQAKQQEVLAGLATKAAEAKKAQIEAEKANDLLSAQKDKDIQTATAQAALEAAKAKNADASYIASLYQSDPVWAHYQETAKVADAYKQTDKVILPAGTNPNIIIGNGQTPVIANASK